MRKITSIELCCQTPDYVKKLNLTLAAQIPHSLSTSDGQMLGFAPPPGGILNFWNSMIGASQPVYAVSGLITYNSKW